MALLGLAELLDLVVTTIATPRIFKPRRGRNQIFMMPAMRGRRGCGRV
jgi:hypothetical protein